LANDKATIVTLDYGVDREEYSVIYIGETWGDLWRMLVDPSTWFRAQESGWTQIPSPPAAKPFALNRPAVVILEYMDASDEVFARCAGLAGIGAKVEDTHETRTGAIKARFPNGGFIAEFAVDTSVLTVRYSDPPSSATTQHFRGEILPPSIARINGTDVGNIHFDIGIGILERADSVMDYIEDRSRACAAIANHPSLEAGEAFLVPRPGPIKRDPLTRPPQRPTFAPDPLVRFPRVTIEGASSATPEKCWVCVDVSTRFVGDQRLMGSAVFKLYCTDQD
jgi:hypothetical protein